MAKVFRAVDVLDVRHVGRLQNHEAVFWNTGQPF